MIDELQGDYYISYTPMPLRENPLPTMLLISNKKMKESYDKFGDTVGFDMTFSLFKEKPFEILGGETTTFKDYQLGFFTGVNNYNKVIIFACVISCKVRKDDIMPILMDFIQHMDGVEPKTFITDQDSAFIGAINELNMCNRMNIQHMYDSWHFLRSLKLKGDNKSKACRAIFKYMMAGDDTELRIAEAYLRENQ